MFKNGQLLWSALLALLLSLSCGGGGNEGGSSPDDGSSTVVSVSPATAFVTAGQSRIFTASVTGNSNTSVSWLVVPATGGTISNSGVFTASTVLGEVTVTATSQANTTKQGIAKATVVAIPDATITSTSTQLHIGDTGSASVQAQEGCTYAWTLAGGNPTSGSTSNVIHFTVGRAGTVDLQCVVGNPAGTVATGSLSIPVTEIAPVISYSPSEFTFTLGTVIPAINPLNSGGAATWSVDPAFPAGVLLDSRTGAISGNPAAVSVARLYTISARNSGGSSIATLSLAVNDIPVAIAYNPSSFSFLRGIPIPAISPTTSGGKVLSWNITPTLPAGLDFHEGSVSGIPNVLSPDTTYTVSAEYAGGLSTATLAIAVNEAPTVISYTPSAYRFRTRVPITPIFPTNTGGPVSSWSIQPTLPQGLQFSSVTGGISGIPSGITPSQMFTVSALNAAGTVSTSLSIEITDAPPIISFTPDSYAVPVGRPIPPIDPVSTGGIPIHWSISPALPSNLALNSSTGAITGTPLGVSNATTYTVTASNPGGIGTATLTLTTLASINTPPSAPLIKHSGMETTRHPLSFEVSSVDPDGDPITFTVSGAVAYISEATNGSAGFSTGAGSGNSPQGLAPLTATGLQTVTVVATDSLGASSVPATHTWTETANRPPQFLSPATGQYTGGGTDPNTISWGASPFTVAAQDPDGDEIHFAITGTPTFVDNSGGAVAGPAVTIHATTGVVSFTGTVPPGKTSVTAGFTVTATDYLPGTATALGASSTQAVTLTYSNANLPPIIQTTSLPPVPQNHGLSNYQLLGHDDTALPATAWTLVSGPAGLVLDAATGIMNWPAASNTLAAGASAPVTVKLTDAGGLSASSTWNLDIGLDAKPTFVNQTYIWTVGGVQFFDPSRVRAQIDSRLKFNWLDVEATDGNFLSDVANNLMGWRANVTATDAEGDSVKYSVKSNSVFRFGVPYLNVAADNYPAVDPDSGEIKWTPNRLRFNNGPTAAGDQSMAGSLGHDYSPNTHASGDSLRNVLDPANWSFTIVAQQYIDGNPTSGQVGETLLVIKVEPNDRPYVGPTRLIWNTPTALAPVANGVFVNGGSGVAGVGRPSLQEPVASDSAVPGQLSRWIWVVGTPGGTNFSNSVTRDDYGLFDPNTNAMDGHQDAIKIDFGSRTETSDHAASGPLVGLQPGYHFPSADTTGNQPALDAGFSLSGGFYNPWINTSASSPGNFVVNWAPLRIQYLLNRYIGQIAYRFGLVSVDQYGRMHNGETVIAPVFGTLRFFNSRFVGLTDQSGTFPWNRGSFVGSGNTESSPTQFNYVLQYLPVGVSSTGTEWVDTGSTATYGATLFGGGTGLGAPASGVANASGSQFTAGAWHTLDGSNSGRIGAYPANPLNTQLNPPGRAMAVPGTSSAGSQAFSQLKGGDADGTGGNPVALSVDASGNYSDNQAMGRVVPSSSPYLFALGNACSAESGDGLSWVRFKDFWREGNPLDPQNPPRWFYGQVQGEVNFQRLFSGRPISYSVSAENSPSLNVDNLFLPGQPAAGGRIRISFVWPTLITASQAGYPAAGMVNTFDQTDILQIATPNLSGNARVFFTGNYPASTPVPGVNNPLGSPSARSLGGSNFFGKFGLTVPPASYTQSGVSASAFPHQPIHAVTQSLWVPNGAFQAFNFPNAYTWPAGGGIGYTDIPLVGIRGWVDGALVTHLASGNTLGSSENILNRAGQFSLLSVGHNPSGNQAVTLDAQDSNANPALISTAMGDRVFFIWLKAGNDRGSGAIHSNAYGAWGGSMLVSGSPTSFKGGLTTIPAFSMANGSLTDTLAQVSFARQGSTMPPLNQPLDGSIQVGNGGWKRSEFESLKGLVAAPAQSGQAARARLVDPSVGPTAGDTLSRATFENPAANTFDGLTQNSLVVYAIKDRGSKVPQNGSTYSSNLGEAGLEPGLPVLAQWWNTGNGDILPAGFPLVMQAYAHEFLPADFTEIAEINHNFAAELVFPGASNVWKIYAQAGLIAPIGHSLLSQAQGIRPVVTPVRQLTINDLQINTATGTTAIGTKLDIFNGNAADLSSGAPAGGAPGYNLNNGNRTSDHRLNGWSNIQVSWQPEISDQRHPSGYIVTLYRVTPGTAVAVLGEWRMGHYGARGVTQTLNLPNFNTLDLQAAPGGHANGENAAYAIKVRNLWLEGTEGAAGHSFDLGKEPWATRFPMAYADAVSGVFVVGY